MGLLVYQFEIKMIVKLYIPTIQFHFYVLFIFSTICKTIPQFFKTKIVIQINSTLSTF